MNFVIAIDGPAASGKGTMARRLAEAYGFAHLDTGLTYRAVAKALSDDVVCAYDLKTGRSRMTRGRAIEIVGTVASVYPLARRILITEVRQTE
jgi:cytidylate kinase